MPTDRPGWVSVTQAIKACGLMPPYPDVLAMVWARELGTLVHETIFLWLGGELDDSTLDPRLAKRLEQFKRWREGFGGDVIGRELEVEDPARRCIGHVDVVVRHGADGVPCIVDVKNGEKEGWHRIQTALYALLYQARFGGPTPLRACLYLTDDDYDYDPHVDRLDFQKAQAVVTVAHLQKEINP